MGTQILNLTLTADDYGGAALEGCPEILAVTRPDAIRDIHRAYLDAGADVLETDTFTGTRLKLDDYKLGERTHEINKAAAQMARAAASILYHLGVDVIGLNCSTGPEHMRESVRWLTENIPLPISTIPNAGLPLNVGGKAVYPMQPLPLAEALAEFVGEFGVNIVGGCCGTTPEHIRRIVPHLGELPPEQLRRPRERLATFDPEAARRTRLLVASAAPAPPLPHHPPPFLP